MRFGVLGPLEVHGDSGPIELTAGKQRALLAILISRGNTPVGADALIEALWHDDPPASARKALSWHLLQLRNTLGDRDRIRYGSAGYRLVVEPDEVDHLRFERGMAEAAALAPRAPAEALESLRHALDLWRGPAYLGLTDSLLHEEADRLDELHITAVERACQLELDLGGHDDLIPRLSGLVGEHPFREELRRLLMLALYRAGRQADALRLFREGRRDSIDALGLEPGPALRDLERRILSADPTLDRSPASGAARRPATATPRQLPADTAAFTGRQSEMDAVTAAALHRNPGTTTVAAIDGMPGVGKTTLAVHVGHALADEYPDGQLFIHMHGHSQGASPVPPSEALHRLLVSMGVEGPQMPSLLDDRAALWRSLTADGRILLLLDDVRDESQVLPLLPASPGSLVIVTSRRQLVGLDNTHFIELDVMRFDESASLFTRLVGEPGRQVTEHASFREVIRLCGGLPLATRLAAARLARQRHWTLRDLEQRLSTQHEALRTLAVGDNSVAASLAMSYQDLSPDLRDAFPRLSLLWNGSIDVAATAALLDVSPVRAADILDELVHVHLLHSRGAEEYGFHDLVGRYAAQIAAGLPEDERREMTRRLLDFYLHRGHAAAIALFPSRERLSLNAPIHRFDGEEVTTVDAAVDWFDRNLRAMRTGVLHAVAHGSDELACRLDWTLTTYFERKRLLDDWLVTAEAAYAAADRLRSPFWRGRTASGLARVRSLLRLPGAERLYGEAAAHFEADGDLRRVAHTHVNLARVYEDAGEFEAGIREVSKGLRIYRELGDVVGIGEANNSIAWYWYMLGRIDEAREHAVVAVRTIAAHAEGTAAHVSALDTLAHVYQADGDHRAALTQLRRALDYNQRSGSVLLEAQLCAAMGSCHAALGDGATAERYWQRAASTLPPQRDSAAQDVLDRIAADRRALRARRSGRPAAA
ncbi:DNA-binding SARP family transcriptional activator [Stackebrandtia albiflava]|uniref:DNA-binding SARP family transcriptional activator n=1 Tax=Stackebrandtia albiflava TaxID=406432 RepID=A0A562V481_9ACTN|nr:BTAD domain-containing putative transcriptional regulator [Stackebrandtia albiflava]TWJ12655.1 DNA-binding SARP family transcriptional activator [Stackebrandtia albiflava]